MNIIYYTYPYFLDCALPLVKEISKEHEVNLIVEISPEHLQGVLFDLSSFDLPEGIYRAEPYLKNSNISNYWENTASFHFIVHTCPKSIHIKPMMLSLKAVRFIRSLKPDIVYIDGFSLRFAWGSFFLRKISKIVGVHDPIPHNGEQNHQDDLARKIIFSQADQFILHNKFQKFDFCSHYKIPGTQVNTVPLGIYDIHQAWLQPGIPSSKKTVLFFGRISPYKGVEVFFKAASLVSKAIKGVDFIIAGKPIRGYVLPEMPELLNNCRFTVHMQYISNELLAVLFQMATIVVCPYLEATQSGVILTAYAFGKPVIASRIGGMPEYIMDGKTGLLVEIDDHEKLAEKIINVLENDLLRMKLEEGVSDIQKEYLNWGRLSQEYIRVFLNKVNHE